MANEQPDDRRLSRAQRKEIHELAVDIGFQPSEFSFEEVIGDEGCLVHRLTHIDTGSNLTFDWDVRFRTGLRLRWWPIFDGSTTNKSAEDWSAAWNWAGIWLAQVKKESENSGRLGSRPTATSMAYVDARRLSKECTILPR